MSTKITPTSSKSVIEFSKKFSTADLYKQYTDEGKSEVEAIKEVTNAFDVFCKGTKNDDYLIERYAGLYNHKKVITPLAFSLITISTSVAFNIGYDVIKNTVKIDNENGGISSAVVGAIMIIIIVLMVVASFAWIFKTMKNTYTPYDIFVLSYERKRLYEELASRGYIVEPIEE